MSALSALRQVGRAALAGGDLGRASLIAAELQRRPGDTAEGLFIAGLVAAASGRVGAALPLVADAVTLAPSAEYLAQHARLLIQGRRDEEALSAAKRAEALGPTDALTFDTIGCVYVRLGDHAAALRSFQEAVARAGNNLDFRYNLAASLGFLGRTAEAEAELEFVVARSPTDGRAHYALSGLRRHSADRNHITRLEAALALAADPDRLKIAYALAKEYEECDRPNDAFQQLAEANSRHRAAIGYQFDQDADIFDAIERRFASLRLPDSPNDKGADPIFIVGMPRTGTTLVDRILSSHPDVRSAGELQAMPLAVKQLSGSRSRRIIDRETIAASIDVSAAALRDLYLDRALPHVAAAARFTDKLPANFLYLGYIAEAFPAARIVCLRRNPMDTIWSNYKHLFASTSPYYAYSYDAVDTAQYWLRFDRLMAFWQERVPGRILELGYERLVADQTGETRRLLTHCRLDWSDGCLHFERNAGGVATPSAAQVRRPISGEAIGRWRTVQDGLADARAVLARAGVMVDD